MNACSVPLEGLRDLGNSVLVVEHDEDTMRRADYILDLARARACGEVNWSRPELWTRFSPIRIRSPRTICGATFRSPCRATASNRRRVEWLDARGERE